MTFDPIKFAQNHPVDLAMVEILDSSLVAQIANEHKKSVRFIRTQLNFILINNGLFLCTSCNKIHKICERTNDRSSWCRKCTTNYNASVYKKNKASKMKKASNVSNKIVGGKGVKCTKQEPIKLEVKGTNEMKSTLIKIIIGGIFAIIALRLSSIGHLPIRNVWDIIMIASITIGYITLVFALHDSYKQHKGKR